MRNFVGAEVSGLAAKSEADFAKTASAASEHDLIVHKPAPNVDTKVSAASLETVSIIQRPLSSASHGYLTFKRSFAIVMIETRHEIGASLRHIPERHHPLATEGRYFMRRINRNLSSLLFRIGAIILYFNIFLLFNASAFAEAECQPNMVTGAATGRGIVVTEFYITRQRSECPVSNQSPSYSIRRGEIWLWFRLEGTTAFLDSVDAEQPIYATYYRKRADGKFSMYGTFTSRYLLDSESARNALTEGKTTPAGTIRKTEALDESLNNAPDGFFDWRTWTSTRVLPAPGVYRVKLVQGSKEICPIDSVSANSSCSVEFNLR